MPMVQQLITAVFAAERQIDDQIGQLSAFVTQLDNVTLKISNAMDGTTQDYGQQMLQQMSATKAEVKRSIQQLQTAKDMLTYVRTI